MAKKWQELKDRTTSPERQEKARERAEAMLAEMLLHEIREARGLSQEEVAKRLERRQPTVVGLEKRADTQVSTLRRYVEALGGELEIVARFPDADIRKSLTEIFRTSIKTSRSPGTGRGTPPTRSTDGGP